MAMMYVATFTGRLWMGMSGIWGTRKNFGLFHVDLETQKRTMYKGANHFATICSCEDNFDLREK